MDEIQMRIRVSKEKDARWSIDNRERRFDPTFRVLI